MAKKRKKKQKTTKKLPNGEIILKVLEAIVDGAMGFIDVWIAVSSPETGFGSSLTKTLRKMDQLHDARSYSGEAVRERHKISTIIYRLKQQGLIKAKPTLGSWITEKGLEKLQKLKLKLTLGKSKKYKVEEENSVKVFAFDIPELLKKYRDQIRETVKRFGYQIVQKSVLVGTAKIPEEFLNDLANLGLLPYIHIFTIGNEGTLEDYLKEYRVRRASLNKK